MRKLGLAFILAVASLWPTKSVGGLIPHEPFNPNLPAEYSHLPDINDASNEEGEEDVVIRRHKDMRGVLYQIYTWKRVEGVVSESYREIRVPREQTFPGPILIPPYFGPTTREEPPDPLGIYFKNILPIEELFNLPGFGFPKDDTLSNPGLNLRKTTPRTRK